MMGTISASQLERSLLCGCDGGGCRRQSCTSGLRGTVQRNENNEKILGSRDRQFLDHGLENANHRVR